MDIYKFILVRSHWCFFRSFVRSIRSLAGLTRTVCAVRPIGLCDGGGGRGRGSGAAWLGQARPGQPNERTDDVDLLPLCCCCCCCRRCLSLHLPKWPNRRRHQATSKSNGGKGGRLGGRNCTKMIGRPANGPSRFSTSPVGRH